MSKGLEQGWLSRSILVFTRHSLYNSLFYFDYVKKYFKVLDKVKLYLIYVKSITNLHMFTICPHKQNHNHQKNFLKHPSHQLFFFTNFINTKSIDYTHHYSYFTCMQDMRALVRELVLGRLSTLCYTYPPRRNTCGLSRNFPSCTRGLPWRDLFGAGKCTFDEPLRTLE